MRSIHWLLGMGLVAGFALAGFLVGNLGGQGGPRRLVDAGGDLDTVKTNRGEAGLAPEAAPVPPAAPPVRPALDSMVRDLSSTEPDVKAAAMQRLAGLSASRRGDLLFLADRSIIQEVTDLLMRRVAEMEVEMVLSPPPISLHVRNASLAAVVSSLATATGTEIVSYANQNPAATYTLDAEDQPFWEIVAQLDRQAPILISGINDTFRFMADAPGRSIDMISIHGPFILFATAAVPPPTTRPGGVLPLPAFNPNQFRWHLAADPRITVLGFSLQWTIVDTAGDAFEMPRTGPPGFQDFVSVMVDRNARSSTLNTQPFFDAHPDGSIAGFKARARLIVGYDFAVTEIEDIQKKLYMPIPVGTGTVTITKMDVRVPRGLDFNFSIRNEPGQDYARYQLIENGGRVILGTACRGGGGIGGGGEVKGPFSLRLKVPQKTKTFDYDFELKPASPVSKHVRPAATGAMP